ncbi:TonB-dependent receptor [Granulicella sp. L60]|uniref:TonB-dependent receptor n=1 Tax=Granulicella sp. L60 TaxID=1641866 RepID=UPI0020B11277|nr:carboxypeptidase regulatory-like domain-containing protein [Granulicella sp. L60]
MKLPSKFSNVIFAFLCLIFMSAGACLAQSTATLSGTVIDPSGAVLPGAHVKVHSVATGIDRDLVTDGAGLYAVPSLQPGEYELQVSSAGFSLYTVKKINLDVDQKVSINAQLALTSAGETIQVDSGAAQIETQTMTVGQVIDAKTVQEIPLNGRHFLDLTVLTPGGVVAPTAGSLTGASRGLGANSFITAGNREDSVNFQINGVNLNDMNQNQITFQPSINTTSEFKIDNSTFSAEYGRSSGSIVNVSTRSGTNGFHGEAFDYFRNEALDARNYFNRSSVSGVAGDKAPLKRNNFGGALGGPIWKDHTFFFFSYEGLQQHQGVLLNSSVFSPAERAQIAATGAPAAQALVALVPVGNDATQTHYTAFTPGPVEINQYTLDILHKISNSDQIHGFYAFQSDSRTEPNLQGNTIPGFGDHRPAHRQVFTLNETHIFNSNFVNEARLGLNRISIVFTPNALLNPANYHIGDSLNGNVGIPQITVSDLSLNFGGPSGFPQGRNDTYGVLSDTATLLRGRHSIKFGGEFRRFIGDSFTGDTGTITYTTTAQFEQDLATGFTLQPTTVSSRVFVNAVGLFVQDNFKMNSRLTLEYGLRFEWNGTPTEGANRFVIFDPTSVSLIRTGTNGVGSVYKQNYNVEPRVGFAWDLFGTAKSVVRGGFALMSDQPVSSVVTGLASNPPFNTSVSYSNANAPISVDNIFNAAAATGLAINSVNPNFRNAYTETFNLNLQQQLPWGVVSSIGYYGSVGRHLRARTNQNQPIDGGPARPFEALSATSPIDPGKSTNVNISEANSVGMSSYNALWLTGSKNFANGLQFNVNYEWSKSLDTNSLGSQGGYTFQDSTNPANNYGASDFDTRNHFAGTAIYSFPFKGNRFVEGYQLSTIVQYQTGNPINVIYNTSTYTGLTGLIRPNLLAPVKVKKIQQPGQTNVSFIQSTVCPIATTLANPGGCSFQNPAILVPAPTATNPAATTTVFTGLGDMQRNSIYGPGFADVDLSGEKDTKITERVTFKLRVDAFDILNHPNFGQPNGGGSFANTASPSTFGQITSTRFATSDGGSSRQLQISGKFLF